MPLSHSDLKPRKEEEEMKRAHELEIPRTQGPPHASRFDIVHELNKTWLGLLFEHCFAFDCLDFGYGFHAIFESGQPPDVFEDIDGFVDS